MEKSDKTDQVRRWGFVRRIFVALLTGGLVYTITNMSDQPQIWVLTVSIFLGGITMVVQSMHNYESRLENTTKKLENFAAQQAVHVDETRLLIKEGFARTNEATELFRAVEESSLRTDVITQLVQHSTQIKPSSPPLVNGFAQSQIGRTSQLLKELSEGGVVSHDGEDREWLLELTIQSQHTIDATSLSTVDAGATGFHGGLWTSDFGQRYLDLQRDAVERGVVIRRLFIFDSTEQTKDSDFMLVYQQQQDMGIHTGVLDLFTIPHTLRNLLYDFVVFDDTISYEVTPASRVEGVCPTIVKTHLALQPQRVRDRIRRFNELWACAQEFTQPWSLRGS